VISRTQPNLQSDTTTRANQGVRQVFSEAVDTNDHPVGFS
jgi:hypothetical protein